MDVEISKIHFLDLPPEIILQILSPLSPSELFSVRLVCKHLNTLISTSLSLQYSSSLTLSKATDNPCSLAPLSEKLSDLKSSEEAWCTLQPKFIMNVPIRHETSGIYDLSGGTYLLGNWDRLALQYMKLPTRREQEIVWNQVKVTAPIIDMGFCVFEHDLIAVITTSRTEAQLPDQVLYAIEMHLLEYSTSKPHPQAKQHRVLVMNHPFERPAIMCETVGEHLVLLLTCSSMGGQRYDDRAFIYDWRGNILKASFSAINKTYFGFIMLSEDLVLFPNTKSGSFDIFRIPTSPIATPLTPIFSLALPALADGTTISHITCRAEPNPIGRTSRLDKRQRAQDRADAGMNESDPFAPKRGFLCEPEEAMCIFQLKLRGEPLVIPQVGINVHFELGRTFTFFVRRKSFLECVERFEGSGSASTYECGSGSAALGPEPVVIPAPPSYNANSPPLEPGAALPPLLQLATDPVPEPTHLRIPWTNWGPPVSRWFNADAFPSRWITTSAGQRCVVIHEEARSEGSPIVVMDFNPNTLKKMKGRIRRVREAEERRIRERKERKEERKKRRDEEERAAMEEEGVQDTMMDDAEQGGKAPTKDKGKSKAPEAPDDSMDVDVDQVETQPNSQLKVNKKIVVAARKRIDKIKAWQAKRKTKSTQPSGSGASSSTPHVSSAQGQRRRRRTPSFFPSPESSSSSSSGDHNDDHEDPDAHTPLPLDASDIADEPLFANILGEGTPQSQQHPPGWNFILGPAVVMGGAWAGNLAAGFGGGPGGQGQVNANANTNNANANNAQGGNPPNVNVVTINANPGGPFPGPPLPPPPPQTHPANANAMPMPIPPIPGFAFNNTTVVHNATFNVINGNVHHFGPGGFGAGAGPQGNGAGAGLGGQGAQVGGVTIVNGSVHTYNMGNTAGQPQPQTQTAGPPGANAGTGPGPSTGAGTGNATVQGQNHVYIGAYTSNPAAAGPPTNPGHSLFFAGSSTSTSNTHSGPLTTADHPGVMEDDEDDAWLTEPDSDEDMPALASISSDGDSIWNEDEDDDDEDEDYDDDDEDEDDDDEEFHDALPDLEELTDSDDDDDLPNLREMTDSDTSFQSPALHPNHATSSGLPPPPPPYTSHIRSDPRHPGRARIRWVDTPSRIEAARSFAEPVEGRLPYVAISSERAYAYDGVLADEERLIGIKTDAIDRIRSIDIFYFG